jgi:hypothetical protein
MYSYRLYGLTLLSDTQISALPEEASPFERPDVTIVLTEEPDWARNAMLLPFTVERPKAGTMDGDDSPFTLISHGRGDFFRLVYGEGARFVVDGDATRIWGTCGPLLTSEDLATYLLGPVMGFVLRRRGCLALHASSVSLFDSAVVLCGPSGSGKSTTAAALALRGVPVLAEDISPIVDGNGVLNVEPGYPRVCLWPETVEALLGDPSALPSLTPTWEKCYLALEGIFDRTKRRVGVVYVLAPRAQEDDAPRIEELGIRDGLLELVRNTYMNWLLDRSQRAAELDMLTRLVASFPVRRVVPHASPHRIPALCDVIIQDAEQLLSRVAASVGR